MEEILTRIWENLGGRVGAPMAFRFILQPLVSGTLAVRDGIKDARTGKPAYLFAVVTEKDHRRELLSEGWHAVVKVFVLALVLDIAYQIIFLKGFFPFEALIVAFFLAFVPYLLIRGPANRIARFWVAKNSAPKGQDK